MNVFVAGPVVISAVWTYTVNTMVGGLLAGSIVGAVPMIMGAMKGKLSLGVVGFVVAVFSGLLGGLLLSIPVAGFFVWKIYRK